MYSITSRTSLQELVSFREQISRVKETQKVVPLVVIGNKSDLENERQVSTQEGMDLAHTFGCAFLESSAKTRVNVEESFFQVVREIRKERNATSSTGGEQQPLRKNKKSKCDIV